LASGRIRTILPSGNYKICRYSLFEAISLLRPEVREFFVFFSKKICGTKVTFPRRSSEQLHNHELTDVHYAHRILRSLFSRHPSGF